jgi:uncharacterized protein (DUF1330 family)
MTAFLVVDIDVHDPEQYQGYVDQAHEYVARHGGVYRVRGGKAESIEGDWLPTRLVVVEFPSKEHAQAFIEDAEYQKVADIRRASARSQFILVEGYG